MNLSHLFHKQFIRLLLLALLITLLAVPLGVEAQDGADNESPAGTPTPDPATIISFLARDDDPLAVDYKALVEKTARLEVAVANNSDAEVTVMGKILNLSLRTDGADGDFIDETELFEFPEVTIPPGDAEILEFKLLSEPPVRPIPVDGTYIGFLVVSAQEVGDVISKPLQLTVALQEKPEPNEVSFEVVGAESLVFDYDKLIESGESKQRVVVAVRNTYIETIKLQGAITVTNVVDENGGPLDLIFNMMALNKDNDNYEEVPSMEIPVGEVKLLTFELVKLAATLILCKIPQVLFRQCKIEGSLFRQCKITGFLIPKTL